MVLPGPSGTGVCGVAWTLLHWGMWCCLDPLALGYVVLPGPSGTGRDSLNTVISDIASLVLGYDMRRLNDVTTFRRSWYRTSLVEAIFIGSKKKMSPELEAVPGEGGSTDVAASTEEEEGN